VPRSEELISPDAIGAAPTEPPPNPDYDVTSSQFYSELVAELQVENAELRMQLDQVEGQLTVEQVKAKMMEPWANKVFTFVCWYCVVLGALVLLSGFNVCGFSLSDTVLSVLAGSTAASVVGLVGIVASGLFGGRRGN
jgi:hypothetical protein